MVQYLSILLMVCFTTAGASNKLVLNGKKYLFVTYGHSVQINCQLSSTDVNVTLYLKRFMTPKKLNVDNVKVRLNKGIFTITRMNNMDGGEYTCKTMNKTGSEKISRVVNVIPVIPKNKRIKMEVNPHSLMLQYEDNANISCGVLGKTKLKWFKVGEHAGDITEVDSRKVTIDDHYDTDGGSRYYHSRLILSITDATKADSGKFKCVAKSDSKIEKWVTVGIREPKKPSVRNFPPVVVASEGISITLKCKTKGSPRPKMTWYKDDKLLGICEGGRSRKCKSFTKTASEFRKNSLTLHKLSHKRNNGRYTCEVDNFMGKYSASTNVIIFNKPVLSKRSDTNFHKVAPVEYRKNHLTVLQCNVASGNPKPELTWEFQASTCLKKSFACKPGGDWKKFVSWSKDKNQFVVAPPLGPGFYRCVATNIVGEDTQVFAVRKLQNEFGK